MNRRDFLKVTAAGVVALVIPGKAKPLPPQPNGFLVCDFIGGPWHKKSMLYYPFKTWMTTSTMKVLVSLPPKKNTGYIACHPEPIWVQYRLRLEGYDSETNLPSRLYMFDWDSVPDEWDWRERFQEEWGIK